MSVSWNRPFVTLGLTNIVNIFGRHRRFGGACCFHIPAGNNVVRVEADLHQCEYLYHNL